MNRKLFPVIFVFMFAVASLLVMPATPADMVRTTLSITEPESTPSDGETCTMRIPVWYDEVVTTQNPDTNYDGNTHRGASSWALADSISAGRGSPSI
ncbi:MAG: hypothetical protein ACP6KW_06795 [Candidatus Thorarchaeota archaeon]